MCVLAANDLYIEICRLLWDVDLVIEQQQPQCDHFRVDLAISS